MKRSVAVMLIACVLLLTIQPQSSDGASPERSSMYWDGSIYGYTTDGSGTVSNPYRSTITDHSGNNTYVTIKSSMEGYPVTIIGENSFSGSMVSVVVPETIEIIEKGAFISCTELADAYFLGGLPQFGTDAFGPDVKFHYIDDTEGWDGYTGNPKEEWEMVTHDGIRYYVMDGEAVVHKYIEGDDVTIPDQVEFLGTTYPVTTIGAYSFHNISNGTISVNLGANLKVICERAFYKCKALVSIDIDDVAYINDEAFRECSQLTWEEGRLAFSGSVRYLGFESFRMCNSITYAKIPDTVEFFGEGVLRASNSLKEVDIGTKELPDWSLDNCRKLEKVTLREGPISIGNNAFVNDTGLKYIVLPSTIVSIGHNAFGGCTSLVSVTIPASVSKIGGGAFSSCSSLRTAFFEGSMPEMGMQVFAGTSVGFEVLYKPSNADSWKDYSEYAASAREDGDDDDLPWTYVVAALAAISAFIIAAVLFRMRKGRDI